MAVTFGPNTHLEQVLCRPPELLPELLSLSRPLLEPNAQMEVGGEMQEVNEVEEIVKSGGDILEPNEQVEAGGGMHEEMELE